MTSKQRSPISWAAGQIGTRQEDIAVDPAGAEPAKVQLGGTTVWAPTEVLLDAALAELRKCIEQSLARHLTIARGVLYKVVRTQLGGAQIDDRILGAVLGWVLRKGEADALVCGSKLDKQYRAFVHVAQFPKLSHAFQFAEDLLGSNDEVSVRNLESKIFGERRYNTWSSAYHVLAHMSYRGIVELTREGNYRLVKGLL